MLAFETAAAIPVTVSNLTPTFYALCVAIVGLFGILARQWVPLRKIQVEENAGLRKEFIEEMAALRLEVSGLRLDNEGLRKGQDALRGENELLRKEVRELHGVIDGLRRENQAAQISGQRAIREHLESLPQSGAANDPQIRFRCRPSSRCRFQQARGCGGA